MKAIIRLLTSAVGIGLLILPVAVFSHHSTSEYEQSITEIEGVVTNVFWKNPHVIFHIATADGEWIVEGGSVSNQNRRGINGDVIKVGDSLKVAGRSSMRRANDMVMSNILLANGLELMLSANGTPRWPDVQQLEVSAPGPTAAQIAEAEANADGLFRIWSWGPERADWFFADPDAFPLTEAALEKFATWDEYTENPQLLCIPPGMPVTMGNPYPIEFTQHDENTIVMRAHEFDVTRIIHLNASLVPTAEESNMGYSVGYWEDENTLIVDTANINYPYFNRVGISSGPDLTVHERFVIDDEAGQIHYTTTITDPWALTEPHTEKMLYVWKPGIELGTYGCEVSEVYAQ
ncbi:MAG: hypothetical protein HOJ88_11385 [Proteobacteria bacterium]|nr:hypothetical protein [Pseudomonadota bacterium]